jgi:hypothetical protein
MIKGFKWASTTIWSSAFKQFWRFATDLRVIHGQISKEIGNFPKKNK